jgi:hypothetical protein
MPFYGLFKLNSGFYSYHFNALAIDERFVIVMGFAKPLEGMVNQFGCLQTCFGYFQWQ